MNGAPLRRPRGPSVAIIGAGFGGLGVAMCLRAAGSTDVTVFEKASDIGGVWRDNSYPGAACDVPSSLYSYSFAPNRRWPRRYSGQAEILAYLRATARESGVLDDVRLGTEVTGAEFDESTLRWRLHIADGTTHEADVLVSAVGQLSRPEVPDLPGTFEGPVFHSARWEHDVDLAGKRVAVIGTGASAVQFVPRIQPVAGRLTVFQRSAPYVVPKPDREYRPAHHRLFATVPGAQGVGRLTTWLVGEVLTFALTSARPLRKLVAAAFRFHLWRQVKDRSLRQKLVPDYPPGCKRLLFSNDWFPALDQPNVDVVTEPIEAVTPHGVRTTDGVEHQADVLIYGTGFRATEFLAPMRICGRNGRELSEEWQAGARAHLGITVPGFPNMFLIYGPNTNLGGNSIIYMIEHQCRYIVQAVQQIARDRSCVEVRKDVAARFDNEMRTRLASTVWSGCTSWYRESTGTIPTNWPGLVFEYHKRTAHFDPSEYHHTQT